MVKVNIDVKSREITSAYVFDVPFDRGKKALEKEGFRIISLEENARLRMQEGINHFVSENVNWVKEDAIYVPNKGRFLTKKEVLIQLIRIS